MTCIIGGKCKDGVVLVADKKITNEKTHQAEYRDKLFIFEKNNFYYPIVIGSSGTVGLYDRFKNKAIEELEKIKSPGFDANGFDPVGFETSVSGIIYPYSPMVDTTAKEVILYPYLESLESIIKNFKKPYSYDFDVLFAAQIISKGAVLCYISDDGLSEDIDKYKVIGSGEIAASVFLRAINPNNITMRDFAKWGFFIIRYIEEYGIDNTVGVGKDKPQIYFIPNEGHLCQADAIFLEECENSKLVMERNLKDLLVEKTNEIH